MVQEELSESQHVRNPCFQCVLESKGGYLPARRSRETKVPDGWDLAVAGQFKKQAATDAVKRLKHIIVQFDTQNSEFSFPSVDVGRVNTPAGLFQFMAKFKQVQDLAKLRFTQFLQATGQG